MKAEKRIYVLVAKTVFAHGKTIHQPIGRIAAQACHVTGLMRVEQHIKSTEPVTTIILVANDNYELADYHVRLIIAGIPVYSFFDTNKKVYGKGSFRTATCTIPVQPSKVKKILGDLPLWS